MKKIPGQGFQWQIHKYLHRYMYAGYIYTGYIQLTCSPVVMTRCFSTSALLRQNQHGHPRHRRRMSLTSVTTIPCLPVKMWQQPCTIFCFTTSVALPFMASSLLMMILSMLSFSSKIKQLVFREIVLTASGLRGRNNTNS